ncbi:MAG TPA: hypothetical protein VG734_26080 [Lacunisphaera sp.]|nr:hypothetical protein [Lacunisphaera sp.]
MSWFKRRQKPPTVREVGCCTVTITMVDGEKHQRLFFGEAIGGDWPYVVSAADRFEAWMERNGDHGFVSVGKMHYVPSCSVKSIVPQFTSHQAEERLG